MVGPPFPCPEGMESGTLFNLHVRLPVMSNLNKRIKRMYIVCWVILITQVVIVFSMTITYPLDTPLSLNPIIAVTVLGAVATITTVLRFWALKLRQVKPGPSEYFILPALVSLIQVN